MPIVISWTALRRELPLPNAQSTKSNLRKGWNKFLGRMRGKGPPSPRSRDCFRGKLYFSGLLPTVGGEWNWFCSEKRDNGDAPIRRGKRNGKFRPDWTIIITSGEKGKCWEILKEVVEICLACAILFLSFTVTAFSSYSKPFWSEGWSWWNNIVVKLRGFERDNVCLCTGLGFSSS